MPYDGFSLLLSVLIVKSNHVFGTQNLLAFDKFNAKLLGIRTKFSLWETTCSNVTIKTPVLNHSHKKRKDSLEKRAVLLIYLLELEIYGVAVQKIHKNSQKWCLCKELLTENGFEAVLATLFSWLWCQRFWSSSEDLCRSKRVSQMFFVCYSLLNSQNMSINNSEKRLVTY